MAYGAIDSLRTYWKQQQNSKSGANFFKAIVFFFAVKNKELNQFHDKQYFSLQQRGSNLSIGLMTRKSNYNRLWS